MNDNQLVLGVLFTTLLLLLLVAGIFIALNMVGKQQMKQQITLAEVELRYEKELRQVETEVSEKMMERFSQELHDNLGHVLTCMRITIENKKIDTPHLVETFKPVEKYLDDALEQLRLLSRSLNTEYISNIGLKKAIQIEVDRLTQLRKNHVHWQGYDEQISVNRDQELMIFRIFQEMIHNSIKHAKAKNLSITLGSTNGFELTVQDDGKGFNATEILQSSNASGLRNMKKRAKMAGMECEIVSSPGNGCTCKLYTKTETQL